MTEQRMAVAGFYRSHPGQSALDGGLVLFSVILCVNWDSMLMFHGYVVAMTILLGISGLTAGLAPSLARTALILIFAVLHETGHKGLGLDSAMEIVLLAVTGWVSAMFGAYRRHTFHVHPEGESADRGEKNS